MRKLQQISKSRYITLGKQCMELHRIGADRKFLCKNAASLKREEWIKVTRKNKKKKECKNSNKTKEDERKEWKGDRERKG
jgi:hypothetical protein